MSRLLAAVLVALTLTGAPGAHAASPNGPAVGFWAGQTTTGCSNPDPSFCPRDLSVYTPAVWNALASSHGTLYLDLIYTSDFGPVVRTDGRDLVRTANRRGVPVKAWLTVPLSHGTFANENNATFMDAAIKAFAAWKTAQHLRIDEIVLDLEFPTGYQAAIDAMNPTTLLAQRGTVDPAHQCAALKTYAGAISWAHQHGLRIGGSPVPFSIDDLHNGDLGLADLIDAAPLLTRGYDHLYVQAYRTYSDTGSDYVAGYLRDIRRYFGATGDVSLGDTSMGPPYTTLRNLVNDVRLLSALGATAIPIFDLDATVKSFGADGLRQIITAGTHPMAAAEVTAAIAPDPNTRATRGFFTGLDTGASAVSPHANAFPNGCGNLRVSPLETAPVDSQVPALRQVPADVASAQLPATGSGAPWLGLVALVGAVLLAPVFHELDHQGG